MKATKRILALLLALTMCLSFFGGAAWAGSADVLTFQNHVYRVYPSGTATTWEEAEAFCEQQGGHLAVINSDEENNAIYQYLLSLGYESAYFGFSDAVSEGTWKWVTGEKNYYTNWYPGEPNNINPWENYAMFYCNFTNGQWNDGDFGSSTTDDDTTAFICEWEDSSTIVSLSTSSLTLYVGKTATLKATVQPSGKTVTWSSSKTDVAAVDKNGKVTAKKVGTCTITASVDGVKATCSVTVKKPTIKLNKSSLSMDVKKTATLKATVDGPSKKVTWKSSDTKIATVDKNGKVTAKKAGKCTVTATANKASAKCEVKVQSEKDKAIEAYKKFLSQDKIDWLNDSSYNASSNYDFCLTYLDNNEVPELMLWERENSWGYAPSRVSAKVALYTYYNGKVKYVDAGNYSAKNYKKKGVYIDSYTGNGGYWAEFYYLFSSGKAAQWLEYEHTMDWSTQREYNNYYKYDSKKKTKIKKSEFKKILKKKVGSAKRSSFTFHKNTKANRDKYLK